MNEADKRTTESNLIPLLPEEEFQRRQRRRESELGHIWDLLDAVKDPEVPAISIWELGVLQDVRQQDGELVVVITPTYSGCPAINTMAEDIQSCLREAGHAGVRVEQRLNPAWSTSWLSADAKRKLTEFGIAACQPDDIGIACPHCESTNVKLVSHFGSTACKALYQCNSCLEPFDYFKNL